MSADVKVVDQNPVTNPTSGNVIPSSPVGSLNKEALPVSGGLPEIQPAGEEVSHEIGQELKDLGVEEKAVIPNLTSEHQELGVEHAVPPVNISSGSSGSASMPMSEKEVEDGVKGRADDSGTNLAKVIRRVRKMLGL